MKHQLFGITIFLFSSMPLFGQSSIATSSDNSEKNSLLLQKGGNDGFVAGIIITITPNPSYGKTIVTLSSELPVQVHLRLLNANGNQVDILPTTQLSSGINQIPLNFSGYPPGLYYLLVVTSSNKIVKKILLL